MTTLIQGARLLDPASGLDKTGDIAIANGRIVGIGSAPADFTARHTINACGLWVLPGIVDLCARLREPGFEHAGMLETEMRAAVAGGITSLVCPPDTDPVLDNPGLVEMLHLRAGRQHQARLFAQGALTKGLQGQVLSEMAHLTHAGCVAFGQAEQPLRDNLVLLRALQYAGTFNYSIWLRPQDATLGSGIAASGPAAQRMGLAGIPAAAETIALHTIFDLMEGTGCHVHLCRISSAKGLALVRQAKARGLAVTCDISINSLWLTDEDIGYFDSRARLQPPLRQSGDREALAAGLADGSIDALVSDHMPVEHDAKEVPFAQAEPGATGLELLLPLTHKWATEQNVELLTALARITSAPAAIMSRGPAAVEKGLGRISLGGPADLCLYDPGCQWHVTPQALASQGKFTPFSSTTLPGRIRATLVGGELVYETAP